MASKTAPYLIKAASSPTLLPFLYKTRTLQEVSPKIYSRYESSYRPTVRSGPRHRNSTITAEERDTFTKIFNDIITSSEEGSPPFSPDDDIPPIPADSNQPLKSEDSISSILAYAAKYTKPSSYGNYTSFRPRVQEDRPIGRTERMRQAIARYPLPLRAAAARAMFMQRQRQEETDGAGESLSVTEDPDDHVRFVRHRELMRVEDLLGAAKTDMDLWKIVEDEAFSLIKKLNKELGEPVPKVLKKGRKAAKGKKRVPVRMVEESRLEAVAQEEKIPSLSLIGPNYPAFLLVAARLLRCNFPTSPLALALLPTIKKYGAISYVLGASTALYNELIFLLWKTHGDFDGIDALLQDMDNGGVEFNEATFGLLAGIDKERLEVRAGQLGETLKILWNTQTMSNSLAALGKWKAVVKARLMEMDIVPLDNFGVVDEDA